MTPCATCGHPVRWMPDARGWACDRCRHFYATLPAAPRSRAWIIVAVTIVLVIGIIAIGVAVQPSDSHGVANTHTRDASEPPKPVPKPARVFAKPGDEYLEKYGEVTDKICACATMDCVTQANLDFGRWVMHWASDDMSRVDFDAETAAKKRTIEERNTACLVKVAKAPAAAAAMPDAVYPSQLAPAPADMPRECAELREVIAHALTCKGTDARMHRGYLMAWSQMLSGWATVTDNEAGRQAYIDACPQLVDGMRTTTGFLCK